MQTCHLYIVLNGVVIGIGKSYCILFVSFVRLENAYSLSWSEWL